MKTAATYSDALKQGADLILFTFKSPTAKELALIAKQLGPTANRIQMIHGFRSLANWLTNFYEG